MGLLFDLGGEKYFLRQHCKQFRKLSETLFDLDVLFSHSFKLCNDTTFIKTSVLIGPSLAPVLTLSQIFSRLTASYLETYKKVIVHRNLF